MANTSQHTGNIGLFYTCYQLSRKGWNVLPTSRNAKGADIIIYNGKKKLGIQVKALSTKSNVPLGRCEFDESVDFWIVLMNIQDEENQKIYIIPQEDILQSKETCTSDNAYDHLVIRNKARKDGSSIYWMNHKFLSLEDSGYAEAWDRLK